VLHEPGEPREAADSRIPGEHQEAGTWERSRARELLAAGRGGQSLADEALEKAWREQIEGAQRTYIALVEQLMERYGWVSDRVHRRKMAREAARAVLPNATETKIVVTGNARAWRTMLELRAGEGAEMEIRRFAVTTLRLLQTEAPGFFSDFVIYVADDRREAAKVEYHKV
jgi:thymidylate synthase (FAD)